MAILDRRVNRKSLGPRAALAAGVLAVALVAPFAAIQAQDKQDATIQPDIEATIRAAIAQRNHDILDGAAAAYASSRKYDAAQQLLESSLTIRANTSGDRSTAYAEGLMKLGDLSARRGRVEDAVDFYTRASALDNSAETAPALLYLAGHSLAKGDALAAEGFVDRALAAAPKGPVHGRALLIQGNIALANGLAGVAEMHYLQALALAQKGSTDEALGMETYARLLDSQGRSEEAQALLAQSKPIRQARINEISSRFSITEPGAKVGGGVSAPVLLSKWEPEYSEEARAEKMQGTVVLNVVIEPDGRVHQASVAKSLGFGLDEKAMEAIVKWKFAPGKKDGVPVSVQASIEVNFRLL